MNEVYITIGIDSNDNVFDSMINTNRINIGQIMVKNNFSIINNSNLDKLNLICKEIIEQKSNIVVGFAANDYEEIICLKNLLFSKNIFLTSIYIPSQDRLKREKEIALSNIEVNGRWLGISKREIEDQFLSLSNNYDAMTIKLTHLGIINTRC